MSAAPDRMMTLAQRFCGLSADARRALQQKMHAQGLTLELLPIPPRDRTVDTLPASYAQQRLWFLWQMQPQATAYNLTGAFRLNGELNRDAFGVAARTNCLLDPVRHLLVDRTGLCAQFPASAGGGKRSANCRCRQPIPIPTGVFRCALPVRAS